MVPLSRFQPALVFTAVRIPELNRPFSDEPPAPENSQALPKLQAAPAAAEAMFSTGSLPVLPPPAYRSAEKPALPMPFDYTLDFRTLDFRTVDFRQHPELYREGRGE